MTESEENYRKQVKSFKQKQKQLIRNIHELTVDNKKLTTRIDKQLENNNQLENTRDELQNHIEQQKGPSGKGQRTAARTPAGL